MSSVPEVGSGQVAIFPVFKGFRKTTDTEVTAATSSAAGIFRTGFTKAGQDAGIGFSKSFTSSSAASIKDLTAAAAKAAREVSASRLKEQDAAGRLRIAEAQLLETRARYSAESSQAIRAEERLATAQRTLQTVQASVASSTDRLTAAKRDLAAASLAANSAGERSNSVFSRLGGIFNGAGQDGAARFTQGFKDVLGGVLGANILTGIGYTIGRTIGNAARTAIGYGLDGIGLASDLEQSSGAVASVFKDQADIIINESKDAAQSVGLTRATYQKYATIVGAQLKNLGIRQSEVATKTDDLIDLGADLAAQFGGPTSQAVEALSSLLRGERDPIERYGVSLKQVDIDAKKAELGLSDLTGEADKQADVTATLALLWAQTADAQGTFARESDTYAGKQQRLLATLEEQQTRLGEALLPTATDLLQFANDDLVPILAGAISESGPVLVNSIREVMPEVKSLISTAAENLPGAIRLSADAFSGFAKAFKRDSGEVFDPAVWEGFGLSLETAEDNWLRWVASTDAGFVQLTSAGFSWVSAQESYLNFIEAKNQEKSDAIKAYWVTSIDDTILELNARGKDFVATGELWGDGLAEGFRNRTSTVRQAAADLAQEAVRTTANAWDVRSPSRKARELSQYWGDGAALGLIDRKPKLAAASRELASVVTLAEWTSADSARLSQLLTPAPAAAPASGTAAPAARDITVINPDPYVVVAMLMQELGGGMATR